MVDHVIPGMHHVTAIASGAQDNLDFYTRIMGLRLVKRTVNFDAPDIYHLYYGDQVGNPGTLLTFFPSNMPPQAASEHAWRNPCRSPFRRVHWSHGF
jgi:glyoxalase family protein